MTRRALKKGRASVARSGPPTWNLRRIFPTLAAAFREARRLPSAGKIQKTLARHRGRLGNPKSLLAVLRYQNDVLSKIERLRSYTTLRRAADNADSGAQKLSSVINRKASEADEAFAWVEDELLTAVNINKVAKSPLLADFRKELERVAEDAEGRLPPEAEEALARLSEGIWSRSNIHRAIVDKDLPTRKVHDRYGRPWRLTATTYETLMTSPDRKLRSRAFRSYFQEVSRYRYAMAQSLAGHVAYEVAACRMRGGDSVEENVLAESGYDSRLLDTLIKEAGAMRRLYGRSMRLRARALRIKKVRPWDRIAGWGRAKSRRYTFDEARRLILRALAPLGKEIVDICRQAMEPNSWIDARPHPNKQSGAFCEPVYGVHPYIHTTFEGTPSDVLDLAHELGHAVHFRLYQKNQPYHYQDCPDIVSEIPSTLFEALTVDHLLKVETEARESVLSWAITNIETTFFRQVMFVEFERDLYRAVEKSAGYVEVENIWTAVSNRWRTKAQEGHEGEVHVWADIPHFYDTMYVVLYPTAIAASAYLIRGLREDPAMYRQKLLRLMRAGNSLDGAELMSEVGLRLDSSSAYDALRERYIDLIREAEDRVAGR